METRADRRNSGGEGSSIGGSSKVRGYCIVTPRQVYEAGETLEGKVVLTLSAPLDIRAINLRVKGEAHLQWGQMPYLAQETYLDVKLLLYCKTKANRSSHGGSKLHPAGQHTYQFSIQLPNNLPPSFKGEYGSIRYRVYSDIDTTEPVAWYKCSVTFVILKRLDLSDVATAMEPWQLSKQKMFTYLCFVRGPLSATMSINRQGYLPGDTIFINGQVDNNTNKNVTKTTVTLYKVEEYHAFNAKEPKLHYGKVCQVTRGVLKPGESQVWNQVPMQLPAHLTPTSIEHCSIIDVFYLLQMDVYPDSPVPNLKFSIPKSEKDSSSSNITIGTIPRDALQRSRPLLRGSASVTDEEAEEFSSAPPTYDECMSVKVRVHSDDYEVYQDYPPPMYSENYTPVFPSEYRSASDEQRQTLSYGLRSVSTDSETEVFSEEQGSLSDRSQQQESHSVEQESSSSNRSCETDEWETTRL